MFLNSLKVDKDKEIYENLRDKLNLHAGHNVEVQYTWYRLALLGKNADVVPYVKNFLLNNGRMKYLKPVYLAFYEYNKEEALDFFNKNK